MSWPLNHDRERIQVLTVVKMMDFVYWQAVTSDCRNLQANEHEKMERTNGARCEEILKLLLESTMLHQIRLLQHLH
jgi:hypothetical protein